MTKQKTTAAKQTKPPAQTKKPAATARKATTAKKAAAPKPKPEKRATASPQTETVENSAFLHNMIASLNNDMGDFRARFDDDSALTGTERMRLIGAGVRNYGFIEKAWDIARDNQQFLPANFNLQQFTNNLQALDDFRQLFFVLEKFLQVVNECMLRTHRRCQAPKFSSVACRLTVTYIA